MKIVSQQVQLNRRLKRGGESDAHWALFFLFPFFSALYAIWSYRSKWAKNVLWAFVVFYGTTFSTSVETSNKELGASDIHRYAEEVQELYKQPMTVKLALSYFNETGEVDILRTVIAIIVSRFTDKMNVLTTVYALIFGFFMTRNLWYLFERLNRKVSWVTIMLLLVFFLSNPFWYINGFRFNTAMHIYLFGLLPFLYEGKKKGILIAASTVLVHFSFVFPVMILLLYLIAGQRLAIYFYFFIISFFFASINVKQFNNFLENNFPNAFVERSKTYRDEEKVNEFREREEDFMPGAKKKSWHAVWYQKGLYWVLKASFVLLYILYRDNIKSDKKLLRLFCFTLLFWGFANITSSMPSGGRFLLLVSLFALAFLVLFTQRFSNHKYLKDLLVLFTPLFLLFIFVTIRIGFYSISLNTFFGNPFLTFFTDYNISLNDIIK
ncbi:MAG TPA: EpsG family protein [Ferruginibacter sp.]|nr:EpsG family protein [Ferruginibacter sp.]HMP19640.1 EpsG family protein [Ferruginibacter sp.]